MPRKQYGFEPPGVYTSSMMYLDGPWSDVTYGPGPSVHLASDLVCKRLTVQCTLNTNGYSIYAHQINILSGGSINNNGSSGLPGDHPSTPGQGGAGALQMTSGGGGNGGNGLIGDGAYATDVSWSAVKGSIGGTLYGGNGGNGTSTIGGGGGATLWGPSGGPSWQASVRDSGVVFIANNPTDFVYRVKGGPGGGGGGGNGTNRGGGGGGGGGVVRIYAHEINITGGSIAAIGGPGGGGPTGCGGGGGGCGGALLLVVGRIKMNNSATLNVLGGSGGIGDGGVNSSYDGQPGSSGTIHIWSERGLQYILGSTNGTIHPELPSV